MCPFIAFLVLFQLIILICDVTSVQINIKFPSENDKIIKIKEGAQQNFNYTVEDFDDGSKIGFLIEDPKIAEVASPKDFIELYQISDRKYNDQFVIEGKYVGPTNLNVVYQTAANENSQNFTFKVVTTINENEVLSTVFTVMVAVLVSLNTINMGCALDLNVVQSTIKRPSALFIGFFTHYFFMPILAYIIGKFLFYERPYLRLSLFIFGCSPGGSAANMWTVLLKGNLNLAITITFINTLLAIFMLPLWLFTLGKSIFTMNSIAIPYRNILTSLFTLAICLSIGLLIQKYKPQLAKKSKKVLAPISGILLIFIVIFASACYWYLFKLLDWEIILASVLNVWLGFLFGAVFACLFRQKFEDIVSIAVETGVQNTGICYFIIRMALEPPFSDFALTIPVASSCITAIPLTITFLIIRLRNRSKKNSSDSNQTIYNGETTPINVNKTKQIQIDVN